MRWEKRILFLLAPAYFGGVLGEVEVKTVKLERYKIICSHAINLIKLYSLLDAHASLSFVNAEMVLCYSHQKISQSSRFDVAVPREVHKKSFAITSL